LHGFKENGEGQEPYYLGFFLMGAYQDVMGDLHNLFGRVNELHVFLDPDEPAGHYIEEVIEGTTIGQALTSVQYDENELKRRMKAQVDVAIKSDQLKPSEALRLLVDHDRGLTHNPDLPFCGHRSWPTRCARESPSPVRLRDTLRRTDVRHRRPVPTGFRTSPA
jgi:arginine decarboxylase